MPGLYAALFALGVIPRERFLRLRRHGGLHGHPDVGVPGIEANSGSLGMGISKGRGIAWAKRRLGRGGRVVVMVGDGELQEGQNWEALQSAAADRLGDLWVIVDRNELQSDKPTEEIVPLGALEDKLRAFGWMVRTVTAMTTRPFARRSLLSGRAQTSRRCSSHTRSRASRCRSWNTRSLFAREGAPTAGTRELLTTSRSSVLSTSSCRESTRSSRHSASIPSLSILSSRETARGDSLVGEPESGAGVLTSVTDEYVVEAYGKALLELGAENEHLVVLDADLASDCRIRSFELAYPERFVECGIAEQDMVSTAAGLARQGLLPIVNSFAAFLASRANEQIYNQASEGTKVVYALHYAGLVPAGPGKSHQSLRDISVLAALPAMTIVQPANSEETAALLRWAVEDAEANVAIRLAIGPSPRRIEHPHASRATPGRGAVLREGDDAVVLAYGPVMLHEALTAAEILGEQGVCLAVVDMPWLNRFDSDWVASDIAPRSHIFVLEDHAPVGGLGDALRRELAGRPITVFGVEGWPACGTPAEALRFHGLDGRSLADRIRSAM